MPIIIEGNKISYILSFDGIYYPALQDLRKVFWDLNQIDKTTAARTFFHLPIHKQQHINETFSARNQMAWIHAISSVQISTEAIAIEWVNLPPVFL